MLSVEQRVQLRSLLQHLGPTWEQTMGSVLIIRKKLPILRYDSLTLQQLSAQAPLSVLTTITKRIKQGTMISIQSWLRATTSLIQQSAQRSSSVTHLMPAGEWTQASMHSLSHTSRGPTSSLAMEVSEVSLRTSVPSRHSNDKLTIWARSVLSSLRMRTLTTRIVPSH